MCMYFDCIGVLMIVICSQFLCFMPLGASTCALIKYELEMDGYPVWLSESDWICTIWYNLIADHVHQMTNSTTFKRQLKTVLF